uniref:Class I SAM-dependent methyltransferase n=1 Tax=candidate division WOR-3 bacterium TaxID=2052148 RepID=A0A7C4XTV1_UNCW3
MKLKSLFDEEAKGSFVGFSKYETWNQDILSACCGFTLDLGCGDGAYTREMLKRKQKVVSADISEIRLRRVQKNNSLVVNCSAIHIPFKDNVFDSVLFREVLEHLPTYYDQRKALIEIKCVLKNNGRLILSIPNKKILHLAKKYGTLWVNLK